MNMQTLPIAGDIPTSSELVGKVAIVTGSTSGIGLGVAKALARAGARIVINGLGEAGEIDKVRRHIAERFRVDVRYDDSNLLEPAGVARLVDNDIRPSTITLPLRPGNYQMNVRVDGGRWLVPGDLLAIKDEFGGAVGLLVITE